jgi:D-3-phosphoglycerate dehydrogenase
MARILLTYAPSARATWYGDNALSELSSLGELVLRDQEEDLTSEDLLRLAKDCDVIISDKLSAGTEELFRKNEGLLAFVRCAMDIKSIDVEAASRHGVLVTQAGPGFVRAVSELVIAQMINLSRGLAHYYSEYQKGIIPSQTMGRQLAGSTAGIIGFGNIGRTLAPTLRSLGMQVLAYDPFVGTPPLDADLVDLDTLLENSDYVICLAIYNGETESMANEQFFTRMKKNAFFINASRGGLVDEHALEAALASGAIAGASIDVGRGRDDHPTLQLASRPNVLASPHIGGLVPEAIEYQALRTAQQVRTILAGGIPDGAVNPESASRMKRMIPKANGKQ